MSCPVGVDGPGVEIIELICREEFLGILNILGGNPLSVGEGRISLEAVLRFFQHDNRMCIDCFEIHRSIVFSASFSIQNYHIVQFYYGLWSYH